MPGFLAKLPNALCYARILITAVTYAFAYTNARAAFTVAVLVIVLTDILDGPIARRWGHPNREGANLDSLSDFFFYASFPVWAWFLVPEVVLELLPLIAVYVGAYVVVNVWARVRLGQMGFHNVHTRLAGTVAVAFALVTVLWGLNPVLMGALILIGTADLAIRFKRILSEPPARATDGQARPRPGK